MEVITEIENALKILNIREPDFQLLDQDKGFKIFKNSLDKFVKSGDRRWWWEDFKNESFDFQTQGNPYEMINEIIPENTERVWLIVEDTDEPFYPVYDVYPHLIQRVIGECFGFEYYIISKNFDWLICENHHNRLIGVGKILEDYNRDRTVKK